MHTFFSDIPAIHHISQVTDQQHYYDVPQDWLIALTDVRGSTAAIAQGKYRDVNACAASCIAAMLNATEGKDIPYVFGGDGATMLVPPEYENAAQQALLATRDMARDGFGLHLRIGIVPVKGVG